MRAGKADPISDDWKSQRHIKREKDEAIKALYLLGHNIRDIADKVECGNRYVSEWKVDNLEVQRKRTRRLKGKLSDIIKRKNKQQEKLRKSKAAEAKIEE